MIEQNLRSAVAVTTDSAFFTTILSGVSAATSTGSTAEAVRADISNMLKLVTTGADSKLFIVTTPLICKMWAMLTDSKGVSAFPDLGPQGGTINKIPVLVTDGLSAGQVVLMDASGVAGAPGDVGLQKFDESTLQFDTTPDSPVSAATNFVSLWQLNLTAIAVERFFVGIKLRTDAVALTSNSNNYQSGNSPP
jgi:hypothetical protein